MRALLFLLAFAAHAAEPFAVYQAESGLQHAFGSITEWKEAHGGKPLSRVHGAPRVWKVKTTDGVREVARFDGQSALWQAVGAWGKIEGPRTVLIWARVRSNGVLCDGSTRSGADPLRITAADGTWRLHHHSSTTGNLGGFFVGADVGTQNGLQADVAEISVFRSVLSPNELAAEEARLKQKWQNAADLPEKEQIQPHAPFEGLSTKPLRLNGSDGVNTYRIPGLATSVKGTLLAVFDLRHKNGGDLPGDIDVGLMRSTDDGETWSATQRVLDYDGSGVGDPCILVDQKTGRIFVAALWSKGNRAWFGSGPGMTPEETGQFVITHSDDDGVTWSAPVSITSQIKKPEWKLCFDGPGSGIQLRDGTLVMPAQFRDADGTPHSCFIASKDHGETWTMSPPCEGRTSEAQIAETKDGMLISMRDESRSGLRKWQRWDGTRWSIATLDLPDPVCQASLLRHPDGVLLFANPASSKARVTLTVRESRDDGRTWSAGRVIDPRGSMYSCMSVMRDGRVAMIYEGAGGLHLARFALEGRNLAALPEGRFETTGKFGWWPARHAEKLAEPKADVQLVFVGDSITQGWEKAGAEVWRQHFAPMKAANLGFGGDSTQHVLWRIDHGEFDGLSPRHIVLHIGTNNAKHGNFTPAQIADGIRAVVERLKIKCPRATIHLLAIFPRDADAKGEMRVKCAAVNALLPALAAERVRFHDFTSAFLQPDGTLTREIAPDLLHLSAKGYEIWARHLLPHLK